MFPFNMCFVFSAVTSKFWAERRMVFMKENWAMRIHWRYSCDTPAVRCCWSMEMTLAMTIHKTFLHDCVQQCDCDGCHGCYWSKSGTCQNRDNLWDKDDQLAKERQRPSTRSSFKTAFIDVTVTAVRCCWSLETIHTGHP